MLRKSYPLDNQLLADLTIAAQIRCSIAADRFIIEFASDIDIPIRPCVKRAHFFPTFVAYARTHAHTHANKHRLLLNLDTVVVVVDAMLMSCKENCKAKAAQISRVLELGELVRARATSRRSSNCSICSQARLGRIWRAARR